MDSQHFQHMSHSWWAARIFWISFYSIWFDCGSIQIEPESFCILRIQFINRSKLSVRWENFAFHELKNCVNIKKKTNRSSTEIDQFSLKEMQKVITRDRIHTIMHSPNWKSFEKIKRKLMFFWTIKKTRLKWTSSFI